LWVICHPVARTEIA